MQLCGGAPPGWCGLRATVRSLLRRMRFLSGTSSSLSRSSVSRQRLDSGTAMSVFEIFVCSTGNLNLIARWIETTTYEQSRCVGRLLQASATLRDGGESALGSRLSLRRAALLCETTVVVESPCRERSYGLGLGRKGTT